MSLKDFPLFAIACLFALTSLLHAQVGQSNNKAAQPVDRLKEPWWAERHQAILNTAGEHADAQMLLLGDSIIQNFEKATPPDEDFQPSWKQFYAPRRAVNLGFSGDTTANLLWRIRHGEITGLHPRVALLLIGTNNTDVAHQTAVQTEVGIDAVVAELEQRLPDTRILLLAILPSAVSSVKSATDRQVNQYLADVYAENPVVSYLDIGSIFMVGGKLDEAQFYDTRLPHPRPALHPDTSAQHRMAEAIEPTLAKLLAAPPQVPLDGMTSINTALIPVPRLEQDSYDWYARHHAALREAASMSPQIVLIGDSITHFWAGPPYASQSNGPHAWIDTFGDASVLNLGFGWDRTQNVLWRLRQGEFRNLHPGQIVLNIGTNNLTGTSNARVNTPKEIAEAIDEICRQLLTASPASHITVMAIFPRGLLTNGPLREPIRATNKLLADHLRGRSSISFLDLTREFLTPDDSLPTALMPDGTHPSEAGYTIWGNALRAQPTFHQHVQ